MDGIGRGGKNHREGVETSVIPKKGQHGEEVLPGRNSGYLLFALFSGETERACRSGGSVSRVAEGSTDDFTPLSEDRERKIKSIRGTAGPTSGGGGPRGGGIIPRDSFNEPVERRSLFCSD